MLSLSLLAGQLFEQQLDHRAMSSEAHKCVNSKYAASCDTHRRHHRVAENLHELLVGQAHVAGPKEAQVLRAIIILDR